MLRSKKYATGITEIPQSLASNSYRYSKCPQLKYINCLQEKLEFGFKTFICSVSEWSGVSFSRSNNEYIWKRNCKKKFRVADIQQPSSTFAMETVHFISSLRFAVFIIVCLLVEVSTKNVKDVDKTFTGPLENSRENSNNLLTKLDATELTDFHNVSENIILKKYSAKNNIANSVHEILYNEVEMYINNLKPIRTIESEPLSATESLLQSLKKYKIHCNNKYIEQSKFKSNQTNLQNDPNLSAIICNWIFHIRLNNMKNKENKKIESWSNLEYILLKNLLDTFDVNKNHNSLKLQDFIDSRHLSNTQASLMISTVIPGKFPTQIGLSHLKSKINATNPNNQQAGGNSRIYPNYFNSSSLVGLLNCLLNSPAEVNPMPETSTDVLKAPDQTKECYLRISHDLKRYKRYQRDKHSFPKYYIASSLLTKLNAPSNLQSVQNSSKTYGINSYNKVNYTHVYFSTSNKPTTPELTERTRDPTQPSSVPSPDDWRTSDPTQPSNVPSPDNWRTSDPTQPSNAPSPDEGPPSTSSNWNQLKFTRKGRQKRKSTYCASFYVYSLYQDSMILNATCML